MLTSRANDDDYHEAEQANSVAAAQHAFDSARDRHRTHFEDAETKREEARRTREDTFRAFMGDLHSKFLDDEELRTREYDAQEDVLEATFRKEEEERERTFARDEAAREQEFLVLFDALSKHAQWHADLRTRLFSQQERENDGEWVKLETFMTQKFETLRMSLNMELGALAAEGNRPMVRYLVLAFFV